MTPRFTLFASVTGSLLSKVTEWFGTLFKTIWEALVSAFEWLVVTIYNVFMTLYYALFECLIDVFIYILSLFPDMDLSRMEWGLRKIIELWRGFDSILPLSEILICVPLYLTFSLVYAVIRNAIKLIPTIG